MVLVAPRSAKLVEARGARFTLLCGYVFLLLAFVWMLLLWEEGIPYWKVGARATCSSASASGFAGTPASHSLTGSVPVQRAGMASGTADLQRDLGGAIMQSIFGALLTAGYASAAAAAIASRRNGTGQRQRRRTSSRSRSPARRPSPQQYPQYASQIIAGGEAVVPRRRPVGVHGRHHRHRCSARRSSSSSSRASARKTSCSRATTRKTRPRTSNGRLACNR